MTSTSALTRALTSALTSALLGSSDSLGVAAPALTGNPTLAASWDFDKAVSIQTSGGGAIDSVAGADGTSVTLAGSGTARPITTQRAGRGVASFTAANSTILQAASGLGIGTSGCSIVVIAEPKTLTTFASVVEIQQAAATSTVNRVAVQNNTTTFGWQTRKCGSAGGNQDAIQGVAYTLTKTLVVGVSRAGTAAAAQYLNGAGTATVSAGTTTNPAAVDLTTLGGRSVSSALGNFWDGYLYRVLIYSQEITATNAEEIAVWAAANYGTANNA